MSDYRIYKFFDSDTSGTNELDICGNDYEKLIEMCCKYCAFFSLIITDPKSLLLEKLEEFQISHNDMISYNFEHYDKNSVIIQYYRVSSDLCNIILENTESIFSWINGWGYNNPEDPTFYREDGSVFFTSTIHEGECTLYLRNEPIFLNEHWKRQRT